MQFKFVNFRKEFFALVEAQCSLRNCGIEFWYQLKLQPNFRYKVQNKTQILHFCDLRKRGANNFTKES